MIVRSSFLIQKSLDPISYNLFFPDLALPNNHYPPSQLSKSASNFCVSFLILREFWFPKLALCTRLSILVAAVLVPEAPVYKDYLLSGAKSKIRITRQVPRVEAVAVTHAVNESTNDHLWFRVSVADARHSLASLRIGQWIIAHYSLFSFWPSNYSMLTWLCPIFRGNITLFLEDCKENIL
jgi:hypothetical protein